MMNVVRMIVVPAVLWSLASACSGNGENRVPEKEPGSSPQSPAPAFSGHNAYGHLLRVVSFGPRNPNSAGHQSCLTFLTTTLRSLADSLQVGQFSHKGYDGTVLSLSNITASFRPAMRDRILICTHWDTRPRAERDTDHTRWEEPMLGANDGGSGTAVLLELAAIMKSHPPPVGVDLVFFDGEDYGLEGDTANYLLGSRHFAKTKPPGYIPRFGILLDMIGDAELEIPREANSVALAPDVVDLVWQTASALGYQQFTDRQGSEVIDDHLPLNEVGIRTIDLIDFDYPDESNRYWHTHEDTPDKCSAESLGAVGSVIVHVIYAQQPSR